MCLRVIVLIVNGYSRARLTVAHTTHWTGGPRLSKKVSWAWVRERASKQHLFVVSLSSSCLSFCLNFCDGLWPRSVNQRKPLLRILSQTMLQRLFFWGPNSEGSTLDSSLLILFKIYNKWNELPAVGCQSSFLSFHLECFVNVESIWCIILFNSWSVGFKKI